VVEELAGGVELRGSFLAGVLALFLGHA
jgi:hypothetical protein